MSKKIRLKKGLTINLVGEAEKIYASVKATDHYVVKPTDFHGLTPKLIVKIGDKVKAGSPLFFDKSNEKVNFCSPVSGEVVDIVRGAKRKVLEITLKADPEIIYEEFTPLDAASLSREQIIDTMLKGGVWPFVRQKPYDIIANPLDMPKAIFISAFNSAPLAIDINFALDGMDELFQKGLDYIVKLTEGKTHLNIDGKIKPFKVFKTKSEDGTVFVSTVKALEAGVDISVLREDGTTIPLPIGTYKKEIGVSFRVEVEGVVAEVIELETEDNVVEEEIVEAIFDPSKVFTEAKGVEINTVLGPHPSGNIGVQIHHIDPINKGETVWYLKPQDVIAIARLFIKGRYDVSRVIALTGPQILKPRYYQAIAGMSVANLLTDNIREGENRVISGDVLTGQHIDEDGTLGFYHTAVTVIEEGKEQEFLGWMMPGLDKFSASKTFPSWIVSSRKYALNANMHGEERAYVMTGQYEKVLPMDIYPTQLIKACMIDDIELMENLGIYEVSPEDLALCEFVCTSKIEVQSIIRHGLDLVRKENS